jgi:DNA-binding response OmpR family regulator
MKRIIFIDDDPTIQDVVNLILEDEYEVEIFSDGQKILANDFTIPDLFLLDKQLPEFDGLDVCRHLKHQPSTRHVPVVILSATPDIIKLGRDAGADCVLEKPFLITELRQCIGDLLYTDARYQAGK